MIHTTQTDVHTPQIETRDHLVSCTRGWYLKGTSSCHCFVSIQRGAQLFPEKFADSLFNSLDSGGTAYYLNCIDVILFQFLSRERERKSRSYLNLVNRIVRIYSSAHSTYWHVPTGYEEEAQLEPRDQHTSLQSDPCGKNKTQDLIFVGETRDMSQYKQQK